MNSFFEFIIEVYITFNKLQCGNAHTLFCNISKETIRKETTESNIVIEFFIFDVPKQYPKYNIYYCLYTVEF